MSAGNGDRPGWGQMIASVIRAPFEERAAREERARTERLLLEAQSRMLGEAVRRVQPDDDEFTIPLGIGGDGERRELDAGTASQLRKQARKFARRNTHIRGYIRTLERFVIGDGVDITPEHESEELKQRMTAWLDQFKDLNDWDELEDEIPRRTWRDGENFIRYFVRTSDYELEIGDEERRRLQSLGVSASDLGDSREVPEGMVQLRLLPPEQIRDPQDKISHGILTARDDVKTVLAYLWSPNGKDVREVIPASDIEHVKIGVDSDAKRGRSLLEVILKRAKQYEDWLESRITLNFVRSAVALIRKVEGASPAQLSTLATKHESDDRPSQTNRQKALRPGSIVSEGPGISWRFESPNLQASDAQKDGRSILLTKSAATGLPEFIFTGDASNANFASTLVAESPAVREFQSWQDFFEPVYQRIFKRVLLEAARADAIEGLSEEVVRDEVEITVTFPPMIAREEKEHTEANQIRFQNRILSREGWARDEGIDWDVEKERLENELRQAMETGEAHAVPGWPHAHPDAETSAQNNSGGEQGSGEGTGEEPALEPIEVVETTRMGGPTSFMLLDPGRYTLDMLEDVTAEEARAQATTLTKLRERVAQVHGAQAVLNIQERIVRDEDECSESEPYALLSDDGELLGCHVSRAAAERQELAIMLQQAEED